MLLCLFCPCVHCGAFRFLRVTSGNWVQFFLWEHCEFLIRYYSSRNLLSNLKVFALLVLSDCFICSESALVMQHVRSLSEYRSYRCGADLVSGDDVEGGELSLLECCTGIIAACLPACQPLLRLNTKRKLAHPRGLPSIKRIAQTENYVVNWQDFSATLHSPETRFWWWGKIAHSNEVTWFGWSTR